GVLLPGEAAPVVRHDRELGRATLVEGVPRQLPAQEAREAPVEALPGIEEAGRIVVGGVEHSYLGARLGGERRGGGEGEQRERRAKMPHPGERRRKASPSAPTTSASSGPSPQPVGAGPIR